MRSRRNLVIFNVDDFLRIFLQIVDNKFDVTLIFLILFFDNFEKRKKMRKRNLIVEKQIVIYFKIDIKIFIIFEFVFDENKNLSMLIKFTHYFRKFIK